MDSTDEPLALNGGNGVRVLLRKSLQPQYANTYIDDQGQGYIEMEIFIVLMRLDSTEGFNAKSSRIRNTQQLVSMRKMSTNECASSAEERFQLFQMCAEMSQTFDPVLPSIGNIVTSDGTTMSLEKNDLSKAISNKEMWPFLQEPMPHTSQLRFSTGVKQRLEKFVEDTEWTNSPMPSHDMTHLSRSKEAVSKNMAGVAAAVDHCSSLTNQKPDNLTGSRINASAVAIETFLGKLHTETSLEPAVGAVSRSTQREKLSASEPTVILKNVPAVNSPSRKVIVVRLERRVSANASVIESTVHEANKSPIKVIKVFRSSVNQGGSTREHKFQSQSLKQQSEAAATKLVNPFVSGCLAGQNLSEIAPEALRAAGQSHARKTDVEASVHSVHTKRAAIRKRHGVTKSTQAAILDAAKKGIYKCEFCYMEFDEKEKYSIHSAKCGYSNSPVEQIVKEIVPKKIGNDEFGHNFLPVKCAECGEVKRDKFILRAHVRRVHLKIKNHFCHICGKSFYNSTKCKLHVKSHDANRPTKRKPYGRCALCGLACANKSSLNKHILGVHMKQGEFAPVKCDQCGKTCSNKFTLKRHEQKVHLGISKAMCDVCGRSFFDLSELNHHRKTHEETRPQHECNICFKTFTSVSYLNTIHKRLHTGERPYKCRVCNAEFIRKRALVMHAKKHAGRVSVTEGATQYHQELIPESAMNAQDTLF